MKLSPELAPSAELKLLVKLSFPHTPSGFSVRPAPSPLSPQRRSRAAAATPLTHARCADSRGGRPEASFKAEARARRLCPVRRRGLAPWRGGKGCVAGGEALPVPSGLGSCPVSAAVPQGDREPRQCRCAGRVYRAALSWLLCGCGCGLSESSEAEGRPGGRGRWGRLGCESGSARAPDPPQLLSLVSLAEAAGNRGWVN